MEVIADLEVHSRYSRAVSDKMRLLEIAEWAVKKGIGLVGTGDFTHPMWLRELEANLEEDEVGIYKLTPKLKMRNLDKTRFVLTSEVSCVYSHNGKVRRVHIMVYFPSFRDVKKFNADLMLWGANLFSDGRPMISLTPAQVVEIALAVNPKALIIPAHVWTPWYGFYGSASGYDSLREAFGDLEKYIPAVETGLSSDPAMNWRIKELEDKRIVSFGDAHSPQKLGREATVFELKKLSYESLWNAICARGDDFISYTIEFYPEEGKYHYTGHRKCRVSYSPYDVKTKGINCPVCGEVLTIGVASRVENLASLASDIETEIDEFGVRWFKKVVKSRPKYVMLVPLAEILKEALGKGSGVGKIGLMYNLLVDNLGCEFDVLLKTSFEDIKKVAGEKIAEAIKKVRIGDVVILPGYDGVFGEVRIWGKREEESNPIDQGRLF